MDAAEKSFVKSLNLNYGFRYENRKFVPSRSIIDDGKLTLEKYTGELLIYQKTQPDIETYKTMWELFEITFSTLIETQNIQDKKSKISESDVLLLIPILEATYIGKPVTSFQPSLNGEFLLEKVLVGGALVIKNVSEFSDNSLNQLKARISWAINEFRWGHKNLFKESKIDLRLPSIEDLIGNRLNDMETLCNYVQQLYEFKISSVIAYEKVVPSYACQDAKKWQEIGMVESVPEYFEKRLVPDISAYHVEIITEDWLGSNNIYIQIPKWIKQFKLEHGFVINSDLFIPSVKPAIELISEPSVEPRNSSKMLSISYVATQKDLFYKTNCIDILSTSPNLLDSIPFVDPTINTSLINTIFCDVIYEQILLTITKDKIRLSKQLEAAITRAVKKENPYNDLEEIFKEYGQVFCLKFMIGERITKATGFSHFKQEDLAKIVSNGFKELTNCHEILAEWKKLLNQHKMDSARFYSSNSDKIVNLNNIIDIDLYLSNVPKNSNSWKVINRLEIIPLYKLIKDDNFQKEIEILLSDKEQALADGCFILKNNKIRCCTVNFGFLLKSDNYQVIGSIVSNNLKRMDLNLRFKMLTVSGFSIVIEDIDNKEISKETTEDDLMVHWLLIGKPLYVKYFSKKTRNTRILTGTIGITLSCKQNRYVIDIKDEMDKVGLLSLSPEYMIATSFKFLSPNLSPKFQITNHSFEEINSLFEEEDLKSMQNSCRLTWYVISTAHQIFWEHIGHYLKK
ncbi:3745_t:CDS:2, partial [Cetraspora pellucida]